MAAAFYSVKRHPSAEVPLAIWYLRQLAQQPDLIVQLKASRGPVRAVRTWCETSFAASGRQLSAQEANRVVKT